MKLDYIIFCDQTSQDSNGKINVNGIFDKIQASDFPALYQGMTIICRIGSVDVQNISFHASVTHENGTEIGGFSDTAIVDLSKTDKHQFIIRASGFPLIAEGKYTVKVKVNGQDLGSDSFMAVRLVA